MAAQHATAAPVPSWSQLHLNLLCVVRRVAVSRYLDRDGTLQWGEFWVSCVFLLSVIIDSKLFAEKPTPSFCDTTWATLDSFS